jgi:hypothetical protein
VTARARLRGAQRSRWLAAAARGARRWRARCGSSRGRGRAGADPEIEARAQWHLCALTPQRAGPLPGHAVTHEQRGLPRGQAEPGAAIRRLPDRRSRRFFVAGDGVNGEDACGAARGVLQHSGAGPLRVLSASVSADSTSARAAPRGTPRASIHTCTCMASRSTTSTWATGRPALRSRREAHGRKLPSRAHHIWCARSGRAGSLRSLWFRRTADYSASLARAYRSGEVRAHRAPPTTSARAGGVCVHVIRTQLARASPPFREAYGRVERQPGRVG